MHRSDPEHQARLSLRLNPISTDSATDSAEARKRSNTPWAQSSTFAQVRRRPLRRLRPDSEERRLPAHAPCIQMPNARIKQQCSKSAMALNPTHCKYLASAPVQQTYSKNIQAYKHKTPYLRNTLLETPTRRDRRQRQRQHLPAT